jgi:hypothetical protein
MPNVPLALAAHMTQNLMFARRVVVFKRLGQHREGAMTADRLNDLIEHCMRLHRIDGREAHYLNIARFLGVEPITLRRWVTGASPVPRQVDIIMEILHAWPETVRAETVDNLIKRRDKGLEARKQH